MGTSRRLQWHHHLNSVHPQEILQCSQECITEQRLDIISYFLRSWGSFWANHTWQPAETFLGRILRVSRQIIPNLRWKLLNKHFYEWHVANGEEREAESHLLLPLFSLLSSLNMKDTSQKALGEVLLPTSRWKELLVEKIFTRRYSCQGHVISVIEASVRNSITHHHLFFLYEIKETVIIWASDYGISLRL